MYRKSVSENKRKEITTNESERLLMKCWAGSWYIFCSALIQRQAVTEYSVRWRNQQDYIWYFYGIWSACLDDIKERGMFGSFGCKSVSSRRRIGIQTPKHARQIPLMWHWVMCESNEKESQAKKLLFFPFLEMFIILITNKSVLKVEPILFIK